MTAPHFPFFLTEEGEGAENGHVTRAETRCPVTSTRVVVLWVEESTQNYSREVEETSVQTTQIKFASALSAPLLIKRKLNSS